MTELRPGKGAHLDLTEETLDFLYNCFTDMWNACCLTEDAVEANGDVALDELIDTGKGIEYLKDINNSATHWKKAKDNFGTKLYKSLEWQGGEIRVTVVLNQQGALKLDVRYWFDPDNSPTTPWQK